MVLEPDGLETDVFDFGSTELDLIACFWGFLRGAIQTQQNDFQVGYKKYVDLIIIFCLNK